MNKTLHNSDVSGAQIADDENGGRKLVQL